MSEVCVTGDVQEHSKTDTHGRDLRAFFILGKGSAWEMVEYPGGVVVENSLICSNRGHSPWYRGSGQTMGDTDHGYGLCESIPNKGLVAAASQKMPAECMNKFLRHTVERMQNILCTLFTFQSAFTYIMAFSSPHSYEDRNTGFPPILQRRVWS